MWWRDDAVWPIGMLTRHWQTKLRPTYSCFKAKTKVKAFGSEAVAKMKGSMSQPEDKSDVLSFWAIMWGIPYVPSWTYDNVKSNCDDSLNTLFWTITCKSDEYEQVLAQIIVILKSCTYSVYSCNAEAKDLEFEGQGQCQNVCYRGQVQERGLISLSAGIR